MKDPARIVELKRRVASALHDLLLEVEEQGAAADPVLCDGYPFGLSLDDLVAEAQAWQEGLTHEKA